MGIRVMFKLGDEGDAPTSLAEVWRRFDSSRYRIAERRYPPTTRFSWLTRAVTWVVLGGSCRIERDRSILLSRGDVVNVDGGEYSVQVEDGELWIVQIWDLAPFQN